MRGSGGRTRAGGSLRGRRERKKCAAKRARLRSGSGGARPSQAAPAPRRSAAKNPAAKAVAVALSTFSLRATPKKKHHRLEAFVPLQRHLYGDERVFLPCPGSAPLTTGGSAR
jgi:hypothetical protein